MNELIDRCTCTDENRGSVLVFSPQTTRFPGIGHIERPKDITLYLAFHYFLPQTPIIRKSLTRYMALLRQVVTLHFLPLCPVQ